MKVGFFLPATTNEEDLSDLFRWSWKERIVNIFAAIWSESTDACQGMKLNLKMFSYNPFETFNVLNVTDTESYDNLFLSQNFNF